MQIDLLKDLFIRNNWATNFEQAKLIISPPIFNNIYKGALGEVCGRHILERQLKIKLFELDAEEYERFDFKTANGVYVDFKFWSPTFDRDEKTALDEIRAKMNEINAEKVFIINILADREDRPFKPLTSDSNKIIRIPFLCQNNQISPQVLQYLSNELN